MINKDQIDHLANLAKLDLVEAEKKKFAEQLTSVLIYFKQLDEVDIKKVRPTDHITGLHNKTRVDEPRRIFSEQQVMASAPEISKNQIRVKPVLGKK